MSTVITRKEAAARFRVSEKTVDRWIKDGKLTAIKIGRVVRINEADISALLAPDRAA